jgi:hypothetical protein
MYRLKLVVLFFFTLILVGCIFGSDESRYGSDSEIETIIEELGYDEILFSSGWGIMDTDTMKDNDLYDFPVFLAGDKGVLVLARKDLDYKLVFIPQSTEYDIYELDYDFPNLDIIQENVSDYNDDIISNTECNGIITLNLIEDFGIHSYENFGLDSFETVISTDFQLIMYIGHTCYDEQDFSVFLVKYDDNSYSLIGASSISDIIVELYIFDTE